MERGDEGNEGDERNEGDGIGEGAEGGRGRVGSCEKRGCMLQNRDFFMVECTILGMYFDFYTQSLHG